MDLIAAIKEGWSWVGIEPVAVVSQTDFGNLLIKDIQGRYWRLCPEDAYCQVVANNRLALDELVQNQDFLEDWSMAGLTTVAHAKLGPLTAGRKYHLTIPGVLGGDYAIENVRIVSQMEQITFAGDIARQIETLPDHTHVQLRTIE